MTLLWSRTCRRICAAAGQSCTRDFGAKLARGVHDHAEAAGSRSGARSHLDLAQRAPRVQRVAEMSPIFLMAACWLVRESIAAHTMP